MGYVGENPGGLANLVKKCYGGRLAVRIRKKKWQALRIAPQWYLNHALRIAHSDTQVMHLELKKMEKILHLELYQPLVAPNHPFLKGFPLKIIHFWRIPPGSVLRSSSVFPAFDTYNMNIYNTHIYIYIDIYIYMYINIILTVKKIYLSKKCINNSKVPAFLAVRISLL